MLQFWPCNSAKNYCENQEVLANAGIKLEFTNSCTTVLFTARCNDNYVIILHLSFYDHNQYSLCRESFDSRVLKLTLFKLNTCTRILQFYYLIFIPDNQMAKFCWTPCHCYKVSATCFSHFVSLLKEIFAYIPVLEETLIIKTENPFPQCSLRFLVFFFKEFKNQDFKKYKY